MQTLCYLVQHRKEVYLLDRFTGTTSKTPTVTITPSHVAVQESRAKWFCEENAGYEYITLPIHGAMLP